MRCNCSEHFWGLPDNGHTPPLCRIDSKRVSGLCDMLYLAPVGSAITRPSYGLSLFHAIQTDHAPPSGQVLPSQAQPDIHAEAHDHMPLGTQNRKVLSKTCGILVQDINHGVQLSKLQNFFRAVERHVDYKIGCDGITMHDGEPIASIMSEQKTQLPVTGWDYTLHDERSPRVGPELTTRVVDHIAAPLIVNGSVGVWESTGKHPTGSKD